MLRVAALAAAAVVIGGCGGPSYDLFAVDRSGADRNANLRMVVNDGGRVICNGTIDRAMDGDDLLEARELSRELADLARLGIELPPRRGTVLRYDVETSAGPIAFSDNSADRPPAADRLVAFVSRIGEDVCGLER